MDNKPTSISNKASIVFLDAVKYSSYFAPPPKYFFPIKKPLDKKKNGFATPTTVLYILTVVLLSQLYRGFVCIATTHMAIISLNKSIEL